MVFLIYFLYFISFNDVLSVKDDDSLDVDSKEEEYNEEEENKELEGEADADDGEDKYAKDKLHNIFNKPIISPHQSNKVYVNINDSTFNTKYNDCAADIIKYVYSVDKSSRLVYLIINNISSATSYRKLINTFDVLSTKYHDFIFVVDLTYHGKTNKGYISQFFNNLTHHYMAVRSDKKLMNNNKSAYSNLILRTTMNEEDVIMCRACINTVFNMFNIIISKNNSEFQRHINVVNKMQYLKSENIPLAIKLELENQTNYLTTQDIDYIISLDLEQLQWEKKEDNEFLGACVNNYHNTSLNSPFLKSRIIIVDLSNDIQTMKNTVNEGLQYSGDYTVLRFVGNDNKKIRQMVNGYINSKYPQIQVLDLSATNTNVESTTEILKCIKSRYNNLGLILSDQVFQESKSISTPHFLSELSKFKLVTINKEYLPYLDRVVQGVIMTSIEEYILHEEIPYENIDHKKYIQVHYLQLPDNSKVVKVTDSHIIYYINDLTHNVKEKYNIFVSRRGGITKIYSKEELQQMSATVQMKVDEYYRSMPNSQSFLYIRDTIYRLIFAIEFPEACDVTQDMVRSFQNSIASLPSKSSNEQGKHIEAMEINSELLFLPGEEEKKGLFHKLGILSENYRENAGEILNIRQYIEDELTKKINIGSDSIKDVVDYVISLATKGVVSDKKTANLLLLGPPGVGKTQVLIEVCSVLGIGCHVINSPGLGDKTENISGYRRVFVGSRAGDMVEGMRIARRLHYKYLIIVFDEVDKSKNEIKSKLLQITDPLQADWIADDFLEIVLQIGKRAGFAMTANIQSALPGPLLSRSLFVYVEGYSTHEKKTIIRKTLSNMENFITHILPSRPQLSIEEDALNMIVNSSKGNGVREILNLLSTIASSVVLNTIKDKSSDPSSITDILITRGHVQEKLKGKVLDDSLRQMKNSNEPCIFYPVMCQKETQNGDIVDVEFKPIYFEVFSSVGNGQSPGTQAYHIDQLYNLTVSKILSAAIHNRQPIKGSNMSYYIGSRYISVDDQSVSIPVMICAYRYLTGKLMRRDILPIGILNGYGFSAEVASPKASIAKMKMMFEYIDIFILPLYQKEYIETYLGKENYTLKKENGFYRYDIHGGPMEGKSIILAATVHEIITLMFGEKIQPEKNAYKDSVEGFTRSQSQKQLVKRSFMSKQRNK